MLKYLDINIVPNLQKSLKWSHFLSFQRFSFDKHSKPVKFSDLLIKADMYKHKIMLSQEKILSI